MKKICVVTAARSEYGLLKWLMQDIDSTSAFQLQTIVTGGHFLKEQGYTIDLIKEDGFNISYIVDAKLDTTAPARIVESMGRMSAGFAKAFEELEPDFLIVLGDRYELLPICSAALMMRIPIIHIGGGDVTTGAIDDQIRNAITMMADYHFPSTEAAVENIARMRGSMKNIWAVGEPGLDAFNHEELLSRNALASNLCIDANKKWILMTYHPETCESLEYNLKNVKYCIDELIKETNQQVIITYANADFGGEQINEYVRQKAKEYPDIIKAIPSLGHRRYLSYMKQVDFVIGNSSSGILETPFLNIPAINIGNRQKGRYLCGNIIQCEPNTEAIRKAMALTEAVRNTPHNDLNHWGDGNTSKRIIQIMKDKICL